MNSSCSDHIQKSEEQKYEIPVLFLIMIFSHKNFLIFGTVEKSELCSLKFFFLYSIFQ